MGLTLQLPSLHAVCSGNPPPPIHSLLQLQIHHPLRPIHRFQLPIHPCLVAIPVSLTTNTHPPILHNCCLPVQWGCSCPRKIEKISVYSSAPELTRILPACPSSPSSGPCPVLATSPHPTKTPPPLPHLHFLPPSTLFQTSGFKPPAQQQPTSQPWCGDRAVLAAPDPPTLESLLAGKQAGARHGGRS